MPDPKVPRVVVLLAAVYYNTSVLFFEAGDSKNGYDFLQPARDKRDSLPENERQGKLYETFDSALAKLALAVRS